jgi:molecular chaperone GrpE
VAKADKARPFKAIAAQGKEDDMSEDNPLPEDVDLQDIEAFLELEQIQALTAERDEYRDKFMRALADAENSRKRADRDRREAEQYGSTRLARDLLPVFDNLNRALQAVTEDQRAQYASLIEGVDLTLRELTNVMTRHGMKPISPTAGDQFDPQLHQAMFEAALPGTKAGQIIQVMTEGFMLHDRLLRPAQVGVSSNTGA